MKYLREVRKKFGDKPAFTARDLKNLLREKGATNQYIQLLTHNLRKTGELKRITRGTYTFRDESQTVGFAFQPFYYGLQDALSLHNVWEQETNPVVITPRKIRPGTRKFQETNYSVRHVSRKMFFGFEPMKYYDLWIPVSTPEKTLIDFAWFKQKLLKETLDEIKPRIRREILEEYLKRVPRLRKQVEKLLASH